MQKTILQIGSRPITQALRILASAAKDSDISIERLGTLAALDPSTLDDLISTGSDAFIVLDFLQDGGWLYKNERNHAGGTSGWDTWKRKVDDLLQYAKKRNLPVTLVAAYHPKHYRSGASLTPLSEERTNRNAEINLWVTKCLNYVDNSRANVLVTIDVPNDVFVYREPDLDHFDRHGLRHIAYGVAKNAGLAWSAPTPVSVEFDKLFNNYSFMLSRGRIPPVERIWHYGKRALIAGNEEAASRCEKLIQLLHNSYVPLTATIGTVRFAYGGIGVLIHARATLSDGVTIGTNVTLGGGASVIGERTYVSTGARVIGSLNIGHHCIIGANAVVLKDVPPYSVVAGVPAKLVRTLTPENCHPYLGYFYHGLDPAEAMQLMWAPRPQEDD